VVSGNTISNFSYAALTYQSGWNVHDNTIYNDNSSPYFGFANNGSGTGTFGSETILTGSPSAAPIPERLAWGSSGSGNHGAPIEPKTIVKATGVSTTDKIPSSA